MTIELFNEDCLVVMSRYPDKYFDLACVDPPYGLGIDGQKEQLNNKNPKHNRKHHEVRNWDNAIPDEVYFRELERVSSHQIIWGANYFVKHLNDAHKGWIFWFKGQEGLTMSDGEIAYSSFDKPTRQVTYNRNQLLLDRTIHPTQKPVKLYDWLLHNYAKPGQRILDTHLGSGSSAIAAHYFGVDFVGCELDKDYFNAAKKRFDLATAQVSLFDGA
jgi:site-specific DNA-methyltransferase (adenine-specific)